MAECICYNVIPNLLQIWEKIAAKVVDDIYLSAATSDDFTVGFLLHALQSSSMTTQTTMNTMLDQWVNAELPDVCVEVAQKYDNSLFMP